MTKAIAALFIVVGCGQKTEATASSSAEPTVDATAVSSSASTSATASATVAAPPVPTDRFTRLEAWIAPRKKEIQFTEAATIGEEYGTNAVRAAAAYEGKPVLMTGEIISVGKDPRGSYVSFVAVREPTTKIVTEELHAYLDADPGTLERIAEADPGEYVQMFCERFKGKAIYFEATGCSPADKPTTIDGLLEQIKADLTRRKKEHEAKTAGSAAPAVTP